MRVVGSSFKFVLGASTTLLQYIWRGVRWLVSSTPQDPCSLCLRVFLFAKKRIITAPSTFHLRDSLSLALSYFYGLLIGIPRRPSRTLLILTLPHLPPVAFVRRMMNIVVLAVPVSPL